VPKGGYFISLDVRDGCAREVIRLAKAAGVALTPAGSTYPLGDDPHDRNIRVAPTFPDLATVTTAAEGMALSVLLATTGS
jgi:DNA-binding transcriptional MocR family regulator